MKTSDITVVVQGAVVPTLTQQVLQSVRAYLPQAQIILSTWENSDVSGLVYDELILNKDPGFFYLSKQPGVKPNNINRQIASTLAGLKIVKTPYVMKLRTDFRLTGSDFLKYFETQPKFNPAFRIFKHKLLACCYTTRNPRDKKIRYAYHMSDIAFFGLTEDVMKLFDIPFMTEEEAYWNPKYNYSNRYMPEQYILLNCLKKLGRNPQCEYLEDCFPENIEETEQYFTSNFIFLNYKNFNLLPSKPNFFAKGELYSFKTCYTQIEAAKLYNRLQKDNVKVPCFDKERWVIYCCFVDLMLAKALARFIFWFIPIRNFRKTYRPKVLEELYKAFTYWF